MYVGFRWDSLPSDVAFVQGTILTTGSFLTSLLKHFCKKKLSSYTDNSTTYPRPPRMNVEVFNPVAPQEETEQDQNIYSTDEDKDESCKKDEESEHENDEHEESEENSNEDENNDDSTEEDSTED
jgi:hypothetical protein